MDSNRNGAPPRFRMLNADMSLVFDLEDGVNLDADNVGACSCIYSGAIGS